MNKLLTSILCLLLTTACLDRLNKKDDGSPAPTSEPPAKSNGPVNAGTGSPSSTPKTDHQVGNGGGGVCIAGSCLTLTEAGLRVSSPDEEYFLLSPELVQSVRDLADLLPVGDFRKTMVAEIVGAGKTYKVLDVADPDKLEVIRERYAKILAEYQPSIDMADVKIFAFSGKCDLKKPYSLEYCTYLLPEFFSLDLPQQAKILLHETNVRDDIKPAQFLKVLEFDGIIEDLLNDPDLLMTDKFRIDRWTALLANFSYMQYDNWKDSDALEASRSLWFAWLKETKGLIFESSKIASVSDSGWLEFDIVLLNSNYVVPPAFARILSEARTVYFNSWGKSNITKAEVEQICQNEMKGESYRSILHPYQEKAPDYKLLRISCLMKNGVLQTQVHTDSQ